MINRLNQRESRIIKTLTSDKSFQKIYRKILLEIRKLNNIKDQYSTEIYKIPNSDVLVLRILSSFEIQLHLIKIPGYKNWKHIQIVTRINCNPKFLKIASTFINKLGKVLHEN